ncbi:hypothetical protein CAMGR0001_2156 [Campylobacter gracilis RM3268]|uniref:Uncharacterized protein n=1 Tax=Campylobacter gracilis RM3268 TaxID=553220 RepID=C8PDR7_9BACT|nr:hypothetical protein CAMGR0001_2156 [Campylobacter gracilis RM3268]
MRDIRKGAALRVSGAPPCPHPRDASDADCVRVKFKLRLLPHKFGLNLCIFFNVVF